MLLVLTSILFAACHADACIGECLYGSSDVPLQRSSTEDNIRHDELTEVHHVKMDLLQRVSIRNHPVDAARTESTAARLEAAVPLAWTHVPKCGTSFINSLVRLPGVCTGQPVGDDVIGPEVQEFPDWLKNCEGLWTGGPVSIGVHMNVGSLYDEVFDGHGMIMLRQPEQRLISQYHYMNNTMHGVSMSGAEYAAILKSSPSLMAGVAVRMLTKEAIDHNSGMTDWEGALGFTRRPDGIFKVVPDLTLTPADVLEAQRRLRGYAYVGITDEWPLSICLLHAMFGGDCHPAEFQDVRLQRNSSADVYDTSILEGFVDHYDGPLYEEALSIFEANLQRYDVSEVSCQPCFKSAGLL